MRGIDLRRAVAALLWIGLILGLTEMCFDTSERTACAADRGVGTKTFESSAAHTAGTEYSSGFLVGSYAEGVLLVNVSAMTGSPTLAIVAETSEDNETYYYHSAIATINAAGATAYQLTNFGKYLRTKTVISGVTSVTFAIEGVFKN